MDMAKKQVKLDLTDRMMPYPKAVPLPSVIQHLTIIQYALDIGNGLMLARLLGELKFSLKPDDPQLLLLAGLSEMLDPKGNSELQLKATLRRRRRGNQHAFQQTVWKRRRLRARVEEEYEKLLASGENRRG